MKSKIKIIKKVNGFRLIASQIIEKLPYGKVKVDWPEPINNQDEVYVVDVAEPN